MRRKNVCQKELLRFRICRGEETPLEEEVADLRYDLHLLRMEDDLDMSKSFPFPSTLTSE